MRRLQIVALNHLRYVPMLKGDSKERHVDLDKAHPGAVAMMCREVVEDVKLETAARLEKGESFRVVFQDIELVNEAGGK